VKLDQTIVRGLAYYTGDSVRAVRREGRVPRDLRRRAYDTLLGALGGAELPALGFGMGDVVLGELLKARGLMPATSAETTGADYWLVPNERVEPATVLRVAAALRAQGASVEYVLNAEKLRTQKSRAQIQNADKAGAKRVLVLDGDGTADVKFLRVPEQPTTRVDVARLLHEDPAVSAAALAEIDPEAAGRASLAPIA
jgi:histidyl-tRNA synthetase